MDLNSYQASAVGREIDSAEAPRRAEPNGTCLYRLDAFGLTIDCEWPLPGSTESRSNRRPSRRATHVRLLSAEAADEEWSKPGERIFDRTYDDGRSYFTVDQGADAYRLWFEGHGRHIVSADGNAVRCEGASLTRDKRERFLFAQVLPLVAVLHGFELLHASAVSGSRGAAAFVGGSGAGKTTLASRLVARGAQFVTDDVLVLEARPEAVVVHPGPPFMALPNEDRALMDGAAGLLGEAVGVSDKVHASPRPAGQAMPVRALYYLEDGPEVRLTPLDAGNVPRLIASSFAPYLSLPTRLYRHLQMAQLVNATVAEFRLEFPKSGSFEEILGILDSHFRQTNI